MATEKVRSIPSGARGRRRQDFLPQSAEAEAAVIGALLVDGDAVGVVRAIVASDDFYTSAHREIMEAICTLDDAGVPIDIVTVTDELDRTNKLDDIGGSPFLGQCSRQMPSSVNVEHYARIVAKRAAQRAGLRLSADIAMLSSGESPVCELLAYVEGAAKDLRGRYGGLDADLLPITPARDVRNQIPPIGILGDILYENTVAILYGASGRWKTFVALGMAASLASGEPWLGRPVHKPGPVVYIAAEGGGAIGKRIRAWEIHHEHEISEQLYILKVPVNLLHAESVDLLIRSIEATVKGAPVALFIDTLSRSMAGGDGNTNQDGGLVMDAACRLRDTFECNVTILAHPGKDASKGISGWLGYFNNSDTVIKIDSESDAPHLAPGDVVRMISEKPKDSEEFQDIYMTAQKISWLLDDSSTVDSLVMVQSVPPETPEPVQRQRHVLSAAEKLLQLIRAHFPTGAVFTTLMNLFLEQTGKSKSTFKRALEDLEATGAVENVNGLYRLCLTAKGE
jgi:hypothetical protein